MTDTMTVEEFHEYQRTGRMPDKFLGQSRSRVLDMVAKEAPELLDEVSSAIASPAKPETQTKAKAQLEEYLMYGGFGRVETEYHFHPKRRWRADYALLDQEPPVLVEYDGLMHPGANASHASIRGILRDSEKSNAATALGYRCFRANAKSIGDGTFFELMESVLKQVSP